MDCVLDCSLALAWALPDETSRPADRFLARLSRNDNLYSMLPIRTDTFLDTETVWRWQSLAQEYTLSAYDAAYLELALRRGLGLATLDQRLSMAARRAGIKVIRPYALRRGMGGRG